MIRTFREINVSDIPANSMVLYLTTPGLDPFGKLPNLREYYEKGVNITRKAMCDPALDLSPQTLIDNHVFADVDPSKVNEYVVYDGDDKISIAIDEGGLGGKRGMTYAQYIAYDGVEDEDAKSRVIKQRANYKTIEDLLSSEDGKVRLRNYIMSLPGQYNFQKRQYETNLPLENAMVDGEDGSKSYLSDDKEKVSVVEEKENQEEVLKELRQDLTMLHKLSDYTLIHMWSFFLILTSATISPDGSEVIYNITRKWVKTNSAGMVKANREIDTFEPPFGYDTLRKKSRGGQFLRELTKEKEELPTQPSTFGMKSEMLSLEYYSDEERCILFAGLPMFESITSKLEYLGIVLNPGNDVNQFLKYLKPSDLDRFAEKTEYPIVRTYSNFLTEVRIEISGPHEKAIVTHKILDKPFQPHPKLLKYLDGIEIPPTIFMKGAAVSNLSNEQRDLRKQILECDFRLKLYDSIARKITRNYMDIKTSATNKLHFEEKTQSEYELIMRNIYAMYKYRRYTDAYNIKGFNREDFIDFIQATSLYTKDGFIFLESYGSEEDRDFVYNIKDRVPLFIDMKLRNKTNMLQRELVCMLDTGLLLGVRADTNCTKIQELTVYNTDDFLNKMRELKCIPVPLEDSSGTSSDYSIRFERLRLQL